MCVYVGLLKERRVHLGKCESLGSYNGPGVARVCKFRLNFLYFSVDHFPSEGALVSFEFI
jgi:hypothetical protein